jgi:hypothetical protein
MASTVTIPQYVEYGARATAPGPFICADGEFQGVVVKGDADLIDAFVERVYTAPAPDGVVYKRVPLCDQLLMLTGNFGKVSATARPFASMGGIREVQLSFWLILMGGTEIAGVFVPDRLVLAVPYIFVDNPMSYAGGREDYGYPKVMGQFSPPDGLGDVVTINAYGGDFNPDAMAGWYPFLQLSPHAESPIGPDANPPSPRAPVSSFDDFVDRATGGRVRRGNASQIGVAGEIPQEAVDAFFMHPHQLFLKQFRDFASTTSAALQQVVEVPIEITMMMPQRSAPGELDLTIHHLDSHPIDTELGVKSQQRLLPWSLAMSFNVLPGRMPEPPALS